ncbi:MAG: hypothetical protein ABIG61_17555 [Planctomycetota bacterium]
MKMIFRGQRRGLTLVELMVTAMLAVIVIFGIAVGMADGFRGFRQMYSRVNEGIAKDAYVSRAEFDAAGRKGSKTTVIMAGDGRWVRLDYFSNPLACLALDSYALFQINNGQLLVSYGTLNEGVPQSPTSSRVLADNVAEGSGFAFASNGTAVKMTLVLDDGRMQMTVNCCPTMHNP